MQDTGNRIRQSRRHAHLTQAGLARAVGVHRSAVAQWESLAGSHPTVEHLARIAITSSVNFEWLATGRGGMKYAPDPAAREEPPALRLEYSAQCETEVRVLAALRRLKFTTMVAIVEMVEALSQPRSLGLNQRTPYSR